VLLDSSENLGCVWLAGHKLGIQFILQEVLHDEHGYLYEVATHGADETVFVPAAAFDAVGLRTLDKQHQNALARSRHWKQKVNQDELRALDSGEEENSDASKPRSSSNTRGQKPGQQQTRSKKRRKHLSGSRVPAKLNRKKTARHQSKLTPEQKQKRKAAHTGNAQKR